jgi:hypothetical protein
MLGRAEQLKVLLAHRQAHHISLLAALLQLMHRQEVQEYDSPQQTRSSSDTAAAAAGEQPYCTLLLSGGTSLSNTKDVALALAGSCKQQWQEQGQGIAALELGQQAVSSLQGVVAAALEAIEEAGDQEDDEFYMPVRSSSSSSSIRCCQHSMHA